jgi:hypothetical protein
MQRISFSRSMIITPVERNLANDEAEAVPAAPAELDITLSLITPVQ